jgi:capsid protein
MPAPIDWIIHRFQRTIVARSREQALNNDYVKAYFRLQRQNIVGPAGIMFQSKAKDEPARGDRARIP